MELGVGGLEEKNRAEHEGLEENCGDCEKSTESTAEAGRTSKTSTLEDLLNPNNGECEESVEQEASLGWPLQSSSVSDAVGNQEKTPQDSAQIKKLKPNISEIELMKERFAKLLLGEDMSGCGKGVCTALAISNAVTNLCATIFGQLWRLEPLPPEKKSMWRREMEWLLCVSDHIVELMPSWQTFPDGSKLEVMTCTPRSDLYINLPALRKLDNMLLEILDGFSNSEFWYVDQGIFASDADGSASLMKASLPLQDKWWLPVPRVPPGGIPEKTRKDLQHKRECTNQILKAAMAINSNALAEMEIPESYLDSLPKNVRSSLGDVVYRCIMSEQFAPDCLLACLDLSSEHQALEIANRVEAAMHSCRRRTTTTRANNKPSWGMVKEMIVDIEKREILADRAQSLLLCLKQRFPGLTQTTLDMSKIQYNKDVGKSILESYSRVLESLAFNVVARIDDLLYADDLAKYSDRFSSTSVVSKVAHKRAPALAGPIANTPYTSAYATPSLSPARLISPVREESLTFTNKKTLTIGNSMKKVLTDYLGLESKVKNSSNLPEVS